MIKFIDRAIDIGQGGTERVRRTVATDKLHATFPTNHICMLNNDSDEFNIGYILDRMIKLDFVRRDRICSHVRAKVYKGRGLNLRHCLHLINNVGQLLDSC